MAAMVFIRPNAGVIAIGAQIVGTKRSGRQDRERSGVQRMTRRVGVDATGRASFVPYAK